MNEWLNTLPKDLREKVRDNLLISGGSIASLLLKEDVNDYDVYIKDMDVLLELAVYYCPGKVLDGRKRVEYLKKDFPHTDLDNPLTVDGLPEYSENFVRLNNLKPDQVKLDINGAGVRCTPKKDAEKIEPYRPVFLSQNAISLNNDIQVVLRFHGDAEQIHKTFDFIHATNYFTFKDGLVLNLEAMTSLMTKELRYQGSLYPLTSIIRMKKFVTRRWTMGAGEILKILFQLNSLDLTHIPTLEEQLIGVDVAYFSTLIEKLRSVEKEKITIGYMNGLIDEIFNNLDE